MTLEHFLPNPITLTCGVVARIELIPMPQRDEGGQFRPHKDTDIQVSLFREEKPIDRLNWDSLISSKAAVILADGTRLNADDLNELDYFGWDQMLEYGMIPGKNIS